MPEKQPHRRWSYPSSEDEVKNAPVVHALFQVGDSMTVCERGGGPPVPFPSQALALDRARAHPETVIREVDCPLCLEWLHA